MRVWLAQGEIERAMQAADELQATAEPGKRFGRVIEAQLLRALALQKQTAGRISSEAVGHLECALDLAEPAGYVLLFLEEGPALIPLLNVVVNRQAVSIRARQHAHTLLDAFLGHAQPVSPRSPGEAPGLVEPLTAREMEVLGLIAAGASNQAIGEKLVITLRTVKKHTGILTERGFGYYRPSLPRPGALRTGLDSPVIIDSFTSEVPSTTLPLAGMLASWRTGSR
jgi:LuxR family transcriptional regulator, maltose regulon positive regulatory protein